MSSPGASVVLPTGLWRSGAHHRDADLRPLTGADEERLAAGDPPTAATVSLLLAATVQRIGRLGAPSLADVRELTVGDREALVLHLRRLTLGESIQCTAACPDCAAPLDIALRVADLLVGPYDHARPVHGAGARFRLPTGADQEALAPLAARDPEEAADALLARCLVDEPGPPPGIEERDAIDSEMAALDPQADLRLSTACPECGTAFAVSFDAGAYLLAELGDAAELYREVHLLASHYHWSEAEIMSLPTSKRRRYLDMATDEERPARGAA